MPHKVVEEAEAVAAARWAATQPTMPYASESVRLADSIAPRELAPFEEPRLSHRARPEVAAEEAEEADEPWPVRLMLRHSRLVMAVLILLTILMMLGLVLFAPYTLR